VTHCIRTQINLSSHLPLHCLTNLIHPILKSHSFSFHSSLHTHHFITSLNINITLSFSVSSFYNMATAVTAAVSFPASKSTSLPTRTSITAPDRIFFKKVTSIHIYSTKSLHFYHCTVIGVWSIRLFCFSGFVTIQRCFSKWKGGFGESPSDNRGTC